MAESSSQSFPETYSQTQELFQKALTHLEKENISYLEKSETVSAEESDLQVNRLFIPATKTSEKLFILTSGVHGAEGYAGSALISTYLTKILKKEHLENYSVLVIHNLNAYGVKHNRRVNENNVDLNRNFVLDKDLYKLQNGEYQRLSSFLNPSESASASFFAKAVFAAKAVKHLAANGMAPLRQAVVGGQSSSPKGVFYRGVKNQPQVAIYKKILDEFTPQYAGIYHVDLHTGYGQRGTLHFFSTNTLAKKTDALRESLFQGYTLDSGKKKNFYKVIGDITQFTHDYLKPKIVLPMTFEFGTQDSQTVLGSLFSLRTMVKENQGHQNQYASKDDQQKIQKDFSELFYPSSKEWRDGVLKQGAEALTTTLQRFADLPLPQ